jgi:4-diphosphocytidyl-2-C-methyl-D-erythritol kinase
VRVLSPAKINLHLRVGPPGQDGFHPIMSWFSTVGFFDLLEIAKADNFEIGLTCNWDDIPTDKNNLVLKAAHALLERSGEIRGCRIYLSKKIPIGGGLGGGSSNAATALRALHSFWELKLPLEFLEEIALSLGSDVPFFLHAPSSVCTGRGEKLFPISRPKPLSAVLIFPRLSVATPAVYQKFDQMKLGSTAAVESQPDWNKWTNLSATELLPLLVNDLEAPAFALHPQLGKLREDIEQFLTRIVRMSGSGSTLFTLTDEPSEAEEIAAFVSDRFVHAQAVELCPSVNSANLGDEVR